MMWGTNIGEARAARSAEEIQRRLATATVVIVGTGLFGIAAGDLGSVETFPIVLNVAGSRRGSTTSTPCSTYRCVPVRDSSTMWSIGRWAWTGSR